MFFSDVLQAYQHHNPGPQGVHTSNPRQSHLSACNIIQHCIACIAGPPYVPSESGRPQFRTINLCIIFKTCRNWEFKQNLGNGSVYKTHTENVQRITHLNKIQSLSAKFGWRISCTIFISPEKRYLIFWFGLQRIANS